MSQKKGEIQIRKIVEADVRTVMAIEQLFYDEGRKQIWPFTFESYWEIYHPEVNFVAELDGKVVGFVVGKIVQGDTRRSIFNRLHTGEPYPPHEWIGWVDMIGIRPEHHYKGIGQTLIEAFYEECKRHNAVMRTVVYDNEEGFTSFLTRVGFKESNVVIYEKE